MCLWDNLASFPQNVLLEGKKEIALNQSFWTRLLESLGLEW